jgi:P4 family phage/plasmid primase-like protien
MSEKPRVCSDRIKIGASGQVTENGCLHLQSEHDRNGCNHLEGVDRQCGCVRPFGRLPEDTEEKPKDLEPDEDLGDDTEGLYDKKTGQPIPRAFARECLRRFPTVTFRDNEETWVYMDGRYVRGTTWIGEYVERLARVEARSATNQLVSQVIGVVCRRSYGDRSEWGRAKMVCLLNGTYDLEKDALVAHSKEHKLLTKVPVNYDPAAKCPKWLKFIEESVPDVTERQALQEMFGYLFEPTNPYQLMFMLIGDTGTGKSTTLRVVNALLGGDTNVSHQTLQQLSSSRFSPAHLYGKMANTLADLPERVVTDLGAIKMLSGEDAQDVERKGKDFFSLAWGGKAVFSCNRLPELRSAGEEFFRRWICIRFPNSRVRPGCPPPDPRLSEKLVEELPGILNWALEGRRRLLKRDGFDPSLQSGESGIKQQWLDTANPIRKYVRERIVYERGRDISTDALYADYLDWCDGEPMKMKGFSEAFHAEAKVETCKVPTPGGKRVRGFRGLRLRLNGDSPVGQKTLESASGPQIGPDVTDGTYPYTAVQSPLRVPVQGYVPSVPCGTEGKEEEKEVPSIPTIEKMERGVDRAQSLTKTFGKWDLAAFQATMRLQGVGPSQSTDVLNELVRIGKVQKEDWGYKWTQ